MPHKPIEPEQTPRHKGCPPIAPIESSSTECPPFDPQQPVFISVEFLKQLLTTLVRPLNWQQTGAETFEAKTEFQNLVYRISRAPITGKNWASVYVGHGRGPFRDSKKECFSDCEAHYQKRVLSLFDFNK